MIKSINNVFWAVYDKKWRVVSISKGKRTAQEEALKQSKHRWTLQTFEKDWGYLEKDGHHLLKSRIVPEEKWCVLAREWLPMTITTVCWGLGTVWLVLRAVILTWFREAVSTIKVKQNDQPREKRDCQKSRL